MIRALIFDLSGTLVDIDFIRGRLEKEILREFGVRLNKDAFFYERLKILELMDKEDKLLRILENNELKVRDLRPLIQRKTLEKLSEKFKLAVVSNNTRKFVNMVLEKFNLSEFFDVIITFEDSYPKPSPMPYIEAIKKLSLRAEEVLGIGDTNPDAIAAKTSGAFFVSFRRSTILADGKLESFSQLSDPSVLISKPYLEPSYEYLSRKNQVFKTKENLIVKKHREKSSALYETQIHARLYLKKLPVPKPLRLINSTVVMSYIKGLNIVDYITKGGNARIFKQIGRLIAKTFIELGLINRDATLRNFIISDGEIYMVDFEDYAVGRLEESVGVTVANIFSVKGITHQTMVNACKELIKGIEELIQIEKDYIQYAINILKEKIKKFKRDELLNALLLISSGANTCFQ